MPKVRRSARRPKHVCLISDSTGELGERFVNALVTQFPGERITLRKHMFVDSAGTIAKVLDSIPAGTTAIVFHTVIPKELKASIEAQSRQRGLPSFDLTGPAADFIAEHFKAEPVWNVTTLHRVNEDYEKRIQAIEYTLEHDDGAGESTLKKADVILLGPSRVSKTPTCVYLAMKGYRAANIPLIQELGEPAVLAGLKNDHRVVGLYLDPTTLADVRHKRTAELGTNPEGYTELRRVGREISWVRQLYDRYGWKTIDTTHRAIEETAAMVMRLVRKYE
ncbi:MAG: putative pyruvate, phosphate dikinase regulatory protein [Candidatus Omnitrophica bacterium]|nr:putative pyruvate, phosphate dikinase regulatory protein [Candidatus Omnitrophota bacterium]